MSSFIFRLPFVFVWARAEKGRFDVSIEELAFRQFVNQIVTPNQDYFEMLASKVDDLQKSGREGYPPLEILKHKPITLSGNRHNLPPNLSSLTGEKRTEQEKRLRASKMAQAVIPSLPADFLSLVEKRDEPVMLRIDRALAASNGQLAEIETVFEGIGKEIDSLIQKSDHAGRTQSEKRRLVEKGEIKNYILDVEIKNRAFEVGLGRSIEAKEETLILYCRKAGVV